MIQAFWGWIIGHVGESLSIASVVAGATGWIAKHLSGLAEKEVTFLDGKALAAVSNPTAHAFLVEVEAAIVKAFPDAGDAKYAMLASLIAAEVPPVAQEATRAILIATLTAIGQGAKAGLTDALAAPAPATSTPVQ